MRTGRWGPADLSQGPRVGDGGDWDLAETPRRRAGRQDGSPTKLFAPFCLFPEPYLAQAHDIDSGRANTQHHRSHH